MILFSILGVIMLLIVVWVLEKQNSHMEYLILLHVASHLII